MNARVIANWTGGIVALILLIAASHGTRAKPVGHRPDSGVGEVTQQAVRELIESCDVLTMGMGHSSWVGVVLKDETQLVVTGLDAAEFFYETLGAYYEDPSDIPDRCKIIFNVE